MTRKQEGHLPLLVRPATDQLVIGSEPVAVCGGCCSRPDKCELLCLSAGAGEGMLGLDAPEGNNAYLCDSRQPSWCWKSGTPVVVCPGRTIDLVCRGGKQKRIQVAKIGPTCQLTATVIDLSNQIQAAAN